MITFYLCFLAGGAVIPIVSFILGSLGNDVDTDTDMDVELDADIGTDFDADVDIGADIDMDTDIDIGLDPDIGVDTDFDIGGDVDADISLHTPVMDADPGHVTGHNTGTGSAVGRGPETGSVFTLGLIPTSLMSLSALALTFGGVGGLLTYAIHSKVITFILALLAGYFASVVVQSLVKTLRKVQRRNEGVNENELLLYNGKVVDTILPGQLGTVSILTLSNILVSYPAKCADESLRLETGKVIRVLEMKDGILLVEPKNKYED